MKKKFFLDLKKQNKIATTSSGMAKASASSPLAMGKKSAWASNTLFRRNRSRGFADTRLELKQKPKRFGHAFMFDSGSSTGEIIGHSKVLYLLLARSGHVEDNYVSHHSLLQVINAVSIRHQRPFRAATAGDDNLIIFHQGNGAALYVYETKLLNSIP
jgi:hypothetical protein